MKLLDAIAKANELRPNTIRDEFKAQWVRELECEVAEMIGAEMPVFDYPKDTELLMPAPHEYIYVYRLCAMIDQANEDTSLYANDMTVANNAFVAACAWWRRGHTPPDVKRIRGLWD
ncbi:MAG: hypothetical protein IJL83_02265 [Clostridia bacterium]|nr:hypothetical protein [Clostridia bacterium]